MLKTSYMVAIVTVLGIATATAAPDLLSTVPEGSKTVTDWYKQSVYDRHDAKIGAIDDVLVDKSGKVTALMVGVGGFLGIGEKDVAVPFEAVRVTKKSNDWYLVMDATKDGLKNAQGYEYNKTTTTWVRVKK